MKGGPLFSKLFRLDLTNPFSLRPKFPEILVEWIAPSVSSGYPNTEKRVEIYNAHGSIFDDIRGVGIADERLS